MEEAGVINNFMTDSNDLGNYLSETLMSCSSTFPARSANNDNTSTNRQTEEHLKKHLNRLIEHLKLNGLYAVEKVIKTKKSSNEEVLINVWQETWKNYERIKLIYSLEVSNRFEIVVLFKFIAKFFLLKRAIKTIGSPVLSSYHTRK